MPLGPDCIPKIRPNIIKKIYDEIDNKITNRLSTWPKKQLFYVIVQDHYLNEEEIKLISEVYVNAGWRKVKYKTSDENGERGGLAKFMFYREKYEL